ncbi:MAG: hypothetical protein LUF90_05655 [Rikenellaceae bacterium]|nr:hypothetical protein [Rikenellaceae bacterium]
MSVLLFTNCAVRKIPTSFNSISSDTVIIKETFRDTLIAVKADSSMIKALLECDSIGQVRMKELIEYRQGDKVSIPQVKISENILISSVVVDSMDIYLSLKDFYEERISNREERVTEIIEIVRMSGWQRFWCRIGQACGMLLTIVFILRMNRLKLF